MNTMASVFLKKALRNVPRLISLMDRNPMSETYGCFDRFFWHYKKSDIPLSSIQCGVYSIALLYNNRFGAEENPYYKNKKVLEWITAGIGFWCRIQNRNGSFDDYYPNECSYIATSLGLYPIAKTVGMIGDDIAKDNPRVYAASIKAIRKASYFLSKNSEKKVANQEACAATAIFYANKLLKDRSLKAAYEKKIREVIAGQNEEGWFPEYEGFDIGYLSFHIDFFSALYQETKDRKLVLPLEKATAFISYFMHPDYTVGGEYSARSTEFIIPSGFARLRREVPAADEIYQFIRNALIEDKGFSVDVLDYRYLPIYLHQYIEAALVEDDDNVIEKRESPTAGRYGLSGMARQRQGRGLPFNSEPFEKDFPNAGVFVKKTKDFYVIVGTKKGGVIKAYNIPKKTLIYSDCGYVFPEKKGSYLATSYYDTERKITIEKTESSENRINSKTTITIEGGYYKVKDITPGVIKHMALRVVTFAQFASKTLRESIKHYMITRKRLIKRPFRRVIEFRTSENKRTGNLAEETLTIKDYIGIEKSGYAIDKFSFRYTPSAKYFDKNELLMFSKAKVAGGEGRERTAIIKI